MGIRYNPALDGLRALAVLAVVGRHAYAPGFVGGFFGVDVFFVLSGFLITRVLLASPDLPTFYWRRVRRLVPALALMLMAYLLVFPLFVPVYPHARDAALGFFYLADYSFAFWQLPKYIGHLWSLSVEEHFYLLWPLVLLRFKPSLAFLACVYVLDTLWRWSYPDWFEAYYRFDMRLTGLVLGCMIARVEVPKFPAWPGLLVLALACAFVSRDAWYTAGPGMVAVELAAAVAILGTPPKWLVSPSLVYLGKLSYGIYLWHFPISLILRAQGLQWGGVLLGSLALSIGFAALSYHTLEAYFRQRRGSGAVGTVNPVV